MEPQKTWNSQNNLKRKKKNKTKPGYRAPWFQIILQSYSNQNSMVMSKDTCRSKNRVESSEINPIINSELTYNKGVKNGKGQWERMVFKLCWKN